MGEGGLNHNESPWLVWSEKAVGGPHHHLLPTSSLPRQRAGNRKDQDWCKALEKRGAVNF